ncbi:MAG: SCO family protein [Terricaulis sp.]
MTCGEWPSRRLVLAGGLATLGTAACTPAPTNEFSGLGRGIDNLVLNSSSGEDVRWRSLNGAPRALFFGFTNCPVICPVTIYELTAAAERLGAVAEDLRIDFVTVDPERDTPERMREYFSGFGPKVTGFTGAEDALGRLRTAFEITARRVPLEHGDYTMDHTATVFLRNRAGRVEDVIAYGSEQDVIDARLNTLLNA